MLDNVALPLHRKQGFSRSGSPRLWDVAAAIACVVVAPGDDDFGDVFLELLARRSCGWPSTIAKDDRPGRPSRTTRAARSSASATKPASPDRALVLPSGPRGCDASIGLRLERVELAGQPGFAVAGNDVTDEASFSSSASLAGSDETIARVSARSRSGLAVARRAACGSAEEGARVPRTFSTLNSLFRR
jgi:hypothetical protein